jgi:hypothetical protein
MTKLLTAPKNPLGTATAVCLPDRDNHTSRPPTLGELRNEAMWQTTD